MAGENLSAVADEEFFARQRTLDVEKWLKSERAGRDLCGSMAYCVFCVKAETHPCAKAEFRYKMRAALREIEADAVAADAAPEQSAPDENTQNALREECAEEIIDEVLADESAGKEVAPERAAEEIMQDGSDKGKSALPEGYEEVIRLRRSFKSKLIQNAQAQDRYTELKNALAGISGIKSRLCQGCENFRIGRKKDRKNEYRRQNARIVPCARSRRIRGYEVPLFRRFRKKDVRRNADEAAHHERQGAQARKGADRGARGKVGRGKRRLCLYGLPFPLQDG